MHSQDGPLSEVLKRLPIQDPVLVFAILLLIVLISPLILRKVRIPGIMGLILFGVLLGPHTFNILEKNAAIELFSTIGLLYIMFTAGLDLDLNEFSRSKYRSISFGALTFLIPLIIGFVVFYFLLQFELIASLLVASVFSTQTLVAYPIVSKLGLSDNRAVVVAVGGTIITDTAVLILLAILSGIHDDNLSWIFFGRLVVSLALALAAVYFLVPPLSRWFFTKVTSDPNAHFVFVLAIVFVSGFMTKAAGIEPIVGAFFSGLVFNKLIPRTSLLMNRLMFVGHALFIPFFLISVGMIVDLKVLISGGYTLFLALLFITLSLGSKWLSARIAAVRFGFTHIERNLLFGLSSSHAAATLAIVMIGYQKGIIDNSILNGAIILVLVTCVNAIIFTEKAARKVVIHNDLEPKNGSAKQSTQHMLIPVANFDHMTSYIEFALVMGGQKPGTSIHILSVVKNDGEAERNLLIAKKNLEQLSILAGGTDTEVLTHATIDYNLSQGIIRSARELQITTIIIGWPGGGKSVGKFLDPFIDRRAPGHEQDILCCHFPNQLGTQKRIVTIFPEWSEKDSASLFWLKKMDQMAADSHIPVLHLTAAAELIADVTSTKSNLIKANDLVVLCSPREGSLTWASNLSTLPDDLIGNFPDHNLIVVLPHTGMIVNRYNSYQDMNPDILKPHSLLKRRRN